MLSHDSLMLREGPLTVLVRALDGCPDLQAYVSGLASGVPVVWLDSARQHPVTGRWSLVGHDPWLTLTAQGERIALHTSAGTSVWRQHPLDALRQILERYRLPVRAVPQRRALGLMGFFSYDLNRWIERLPPPQPAGPSTPDMAWFGMRVVLLVDHLERRSWIISVADPHSLSGFARRDAIARLEEASAALARIAPIASAPCRTGRLQPTSSQAEFEGMVARALEYIRAGEIYQANVSQRFTAEWEGPAFPLYRILRRMNPSPFACFLSWKDLAVVSCSPERLVQAQDGRVSTRPIAGTRPRGTTPDEDALNSLELLTSDKERAEHIMLVDLERNDVGRVCRPGSVCVDELLALESYSHVIHIVSNISGLLRRDADAVDVIRAMFPGGTITGCPKVRCMEILRELEPVARGLYTGSLGYLGFDGAMDLNIAIRTMVLQDHRLSFHAGAGIVADSDPTREYQETLAKAGALMEALAEAGEQTADAAARAS